MSASLWSEEDLSHDMLNMDHTWELRAGLKTFIRRVMEVSNFYKSEFSECRIFSALSLFHCCYDHPPNEILNFNAVETWLYSTSMFTLQSHLSPFELVHVLDLQIISVLSHEAKEDAPVPQLFAPAPFFIF